MDWARADARDLPTTEQGRAHWRDAIAAGHVAPELAQAFAARDNAARETDRPGTRAPARRTTADVTAAIRSAVDDTARRLAELRSRLGEAELDAAHERTVERDRQRNAEFTRWLEQHHAAAADVLEADWTATR